MFIFVLLFRVCMHVSLGILKLAFVLMFIWLSLCTHVKLGILATILSFYVCVVIEVMYTCMNGPFGKEPLCL